MDVCLRLLYSRYHAFQLFNLCRKVCLNGAVGITVNLARNKMFVDGLPLLTKYDYLFFVFSQITHGVDDLGQTIGSVCFIFLSCYLPLVIAFVFILLVLVADPAVTLLIDQPEDDSDDLDSRSIYDTIVPYLIDSKLGRQIIIASHNANLVTGADSEEVIITDRRGADGPNH